MIDLLKHPPGSYIKGRFEPIPGDDLVSTDPTEPDRIIWQGSPAVDHVDQAIEQANATNYGLAASIFTNDDAAYETFFRRVRAGCINRNTGTAGASSTLPFGGLGHSGNHRPAAAFSVDYCAYPVANMVEQSSNAAVPSGMLWDDSWTR